MSLSTTNYTPTSDLKINTAPPVGAFYAWRVRACDASARCGPWSEVRYLHVGRVREDINGDGYGDLLALSNRGIEVYLGAAQFDVSSPSFTIAAGLGTTPTFSGDVNGDGFGDFFSSTNYLPSSGQAPTVYFGAATVTKPATSILTKTAGGPSTLMQTESAGDMNGDGFADLLVQWGYGITTPQTELRIFFGGATLANTPDLSIPGPYVNYYTLQNSGRVGDLNGDGFEDVALTAMSDGASDGGVVQVFSGGLHPTAVPVNVRTTAATYQIEGVGDINGDGFDDALIILSGDHYALYRGAAILPGSASTTWNDATTSSAAGGFDIDRDGFPDFVVGTNAFTSILYRGGPAGPSQVAGGLSRLTNSILVAHSAHDGDGRPDLVGMNNGNDTVYIQWAGSDGTIDPPAVIVRLPVDGMFSGRLVR
jgi:hypothetical protein